MYGKRVVDRAETLDGVMAGRELGKFIENILNVSEVCKYLYSFNNYTKTDFTRKSIAYSLISPH